MVIKSNFIKNLIKGKSFSNKKHREYISELEHVEYVVLNGLTGMYVGLRYNEIKSKYRKEWEAIYKELDPKGFKEKIEQEKKDDRWRKREEEKEKREEQKEEEVQKHKWLLLGGKK